MRHCDKYYDNYECNNRSRLVDNRGRCERYSDPDATFEAVDLDPALLIDFIQFNCVGTTLRVTCSIVVHFNMCRYVDY